ncbi:MULTISPECIES: osmotically-inducible lipoprotein OsmB [Enterobacterales]|uniref:Osmotically-inducible lipoprotein OsmB n=7 Tax=Proteus TaxID=583 RepID=A0A6G6SYD4_9GAMM|nr:MULTISPECIES: osmotically-inducible lipoprotein OsmB [Enterobacterales]EEG83341.1 osmotically-inducible lipoprotein B [Proteus penneri ATCC 35198]EST58888.1 osmotically-inducible lipoprotein [Proteus hauseri ZMd44]MBG2710622.1 osmotically-inducible lipoprotein OsmB [Proteus mirabilis]NBN60944.1 osmotically-inducible lipoprotein OsmB [Proteus sp. G2639]WOO51518.1 osmotically-inducible lipoprotein OsmB [Hafnia alvei]
MNITLKKIGTLCVASVLLFSLAGCSSMTKRDRNTAIGAGAGAIGGAILTDGSALGTIGGGVLGGVIGHQVGKK